MLSIASTGHLSRPETSLSRVISSKVKLSYLSKTVKWLRGDNAHSNLSIIFRRASLALISSMLIVSLIGIPLLLSGVKEWKKQQHNKKLLHIEPIVLDTPISDQPITVKLTPAQILSQHKKELLRHAVDPLLRAEPPFFPTSSTNPPWKTMMGISLIADYLAKKKTIWTPYLFANRLKLLKTKLIR